MAKFCLPILERGKVEASGKPRNFSSSRGPSSQAYGVPYVSIGSKSESCSLDIFIFATQDVFDSRTETQMEQSRGSWCTEQMGVEKGLFNPAFRAINGSWGGRVTGTRDGFVLAGAPTVKYIRYVQGK